jgi:hypothetical protein
MFITGFAAVALNADSTAPKHAKVLSKPIHLRDLVNEVQKMLAAYFSTSEAAASCSSASSRSRLSCSVVLFGSFSEGCC